MKFVSCALLLCASSVMAKNIIIECTGVFGNNCPSDYKKEYRGSSAKDSSCFCIRPETREEESQRRKAEEPKRCRDAISACKMYGQSYENYSGPNNRCEDAMVTCQNLETVEELCTYLKQENAKWQCDKSWAYKDLVAANKGH